MNYSPNRLARGYVREEMRVHNGFSDKYAELLDHLFHMLSKSLLRGRILTENESTRARFGTIQKLKKLLQPITHLKFQTQTRKKDERIDGFAYWENVDLNGNLTAVSYDEKGYSLNYVNLGIGRKKFTFEHRFAHLIVREHALYRMIDRGFVEKEPLRELSPFLFDILGLTTFIVATRLKYKKEYKGQSTLLPLRDGLLLGSNSYYVSPAGNLHHKITMTQRSSEIKSQFNDDLDHPTGIFAHHINTYLSSDIMSSAQLWVHKALTKLVKEYKQVIEFHAILTSDSNVIRDLMESETHNLKPCSSVLLSAESELLRIMNTPQWTIAAGNHGRHG